MNNDEYKYVGQTGQLRAGILAPPPWGQPIENVQAKTEKKISGNFARTVQKRGLEGHNITAIMAIRTTIIIYRHTTWLGYNNGLYTICCEYAHIYIHHALQWYLIQFSDISLRFEINFCQGNWNIYVTTATNILFIGRNFAGRMEILPSNTKYFSTGWSKTCAPLREKVRDDKKTNNPILKIKLVQLGRNNH